MWQGLDQASKRSRACFIVRRSTIIRSRKEENDNTKREDLPATGGDHVRVVEVGEAEGHGTEHVLLGKIFLHIF